MKNKSGSKLPSNSMQHWNGDQVCVIDTETTGLDPCWHEMIQIAILPLDANLNIRNDIIPFYINIMPDNPERVDSKALKINRLNLANIAKTGFDREKAKDMLTEWIKKLKLPFTKYGTPKRIIPLGQNYSFDKGFIVNWLGSKLYNELFHYHHRDTMIAALYLNDRAACHGNIIPYSKVGLKWLTNKLNIEHKTRHDALQDCIATAKVYKKLAYQGLMG